MSRNCKELMDYPYDLVDVILEHAEHYYNTNLLGDYNYIIANFEENWEYVKKTLTPREALFIELYYKEFNTLNEIAKGYGVTKERVRQIIAKALRRLSHTSRFDIFIKGYKNMQELKSLHEEVQMQLTELRKLNQKLKTHPEEHTEEINSPKAISIDELKLSVRAYNCLKRAGYKTVEDILKHTTTELLHIRNLGRNALRDIVTQVRFLGFTIVDDEEDSMIDFWEDED